MSANITIESLKPISGGSLKAVAAITIGGKLRIGEIRIVQQPGKELLISMPARSVERGGQRTWLPTIELLDENLKAEVSTAILQEYSKLAESIQPSVPKEWL